MGKIREVFQKMSLKRSLVLLAVFCLSLVSALSVITILTCSSIQKKILDTRPIIITDYVIRDADSNDTENNNGVTAVPQKYAHGELSKENQLYYWCITILMVSLPIAYIIIASFMVAKLYYKWKLKIPLENLKNGMYHISQQDLDFQIQYTSDDELGQLCDTFEHMKNEIYKSNSKMWNMLQERKALTASVSHDLRTPITVLNGYLDYLEKSIERETLTNETLQTTLMRILATLSEPTTGMVEINGIDIKRKKEIRKIIGYLPQEFSIYPNMTVYSALDYLGILAELPNNIRKRRINELLKQVNLEQEKNKRFKNLSGGMKRRFGIAQALLNDPKILIIDEPTAGLDPEERLRFYNLLSELAVERIILLSTHIASDIEATCSKAAVLSSGTVVFEGQIEKLLQPGNGKVYTTTILQNELNQFKQKYRVISIHQNGINVSCRFLSNAAQKKEWVSCQPTIEDSYMYLLSSFKQEVE